MAWLYHGCTEKLSPKVATLIENSHLLISPVVLLELEYLFEIKRVREPAQVVLTALSDDLDVEVAEDSLAAVMQEALALNWTRDVLDRLIVAHALLRKIPLITKDRTLQRHARCIW